MKQLLRTRTEYGVNFCGNRFWILLLFLSKSLSSSSIQQASKEHFDNKGFDRNVDVYD
jgi:hypothetical protein